MFDTVHTLLVQSGFAFQLQHHPPVTTVDDARSKVPHLTVNLIKTVVFNIKEGHWILAGVGASDRIDYKSLGDTFGVNRKLIRPVSPEEVETGLGFEIGGVGPFPVKEDVRVVLDRSLMDAASVFCGSGRNTVTVEMNPGDLAKAVNAIISGIRKP